jgi:hypothetical protein
MAMRANSRQNPKAPKIADSYNLNLKVAVHLAGPRVDADFRGTTSLIRLPYTTIRLTSPDAAIPESYLGANAWVKVAWPVTREDGAGTELRIFGKCVRAGYGEVVVKMYRYALEPVSRDEPPDAQESGEVFNERLLHANGTPRA